MSEPPRRNIGNAFLGIALLLMLFGWVNLNKTLFSLGAVVLFFWMVGKLVAFIARSLGLK